MKQIINWLKLQWLKITDEVYQSNITYPEIHDVVKKKYPKCYLEITDIYKKTCTRELLIRLSELNLSKLMKYKPETFDCEDFSIMAWGIWKLTFPKLAIGLCHVVQKGGAKHSVLCAFTKTEKGTIHFDFIEPQNGKVFLADWKPYMIVI